MAIDVESRQNRQGYMKYSRRGYWSAFNCRANGGLACAGGGGKGKRNGTMLNFYTAFR